MITWLNCGREIEDGDKDKGTRTTPQIICCILNTRVKERYYRNIQGNPYSYSQFHILLTSLCRSFSLLLNYIRKRCRFSWNGYDVNIATPKFSTAHLLGSAAGKVRQIIPCWFQYQLCRKSYGRCMLNPGNCRETLESTITCFPCQQFALQNFLRQKQQVCRT